MRINPVLQATLIKEKELCLKDFNLIVSKVCRYFNVSKQAIISKERSRVLSVPRHIVFYIMNELGHKLTNIGELFNRDHSTVIHGCKNITTLKDLAFDGFCTKSDLELVAKIDAIFAQVWADNYTVKQI